MDHARRVVEAAEAAAREGLGVVSLNGKMVDGPVIDRAVWCSLVQNFPASAKNKAIKMTQKIEQSQRQERVAAWNRRAECDLAAFQNSPKQTYQAEKARDRKLCANLEEAIRRSGLQDGMTVSFHHAFRGGDLTVNMVMDVIAKMGFKNLTLRPAP